ncbi:WD40-repeat-containing domain protein [Boletus reticuloceps]|uniref:WD40-repeat-containing domain protein n=1 Tax=Boletus reticuloceps TaxID=495285 RepID=A0A8I2Z3P3_9AGAM|nr:WD40-repeat-containing domain protein [Boletus reticuloceps]
MSNAVRQQSDNDDPRPHLVISAHDDTISGLAYLPGGHRIVTGSFDGTVKVWNSENGRQEGTSMKHESTVVGLAVTWDGTKIISGEEGGRIKVWDVESHRVVLGWTPPVEYPRIAISPDGQLIAVGDSAVAIYNMRGRRVNDSIKVDTRVWSVSFSPNGYKLACATLDDIRVYDISSGVLILDPLECDEARILCLLWSHDGSRLFSGSGDTMIRCWNADTGEQIGHPWTGHTDWIRSLSLSPDGSILASASWDRTVRFWDATSGHPVGHPLLHEDDLQVVCFSPSGEFVASAGDDRRMYVWRVPWLDLILLPNPYALSTRLIAPSTPSSELQYEMSPSLVIPSPPPDLTPHIVRADDQYVAGGGFGDVYRCWYHDGTPKEVAVKSLRFSFAIDGDASEMSTKTLRRELGIWRRLDHINVVPFLGIAYGFGMRGAMSLVSLWMTNESLHRFLTKHHGNLDVECRLRFLLDIANGLHYLHSFPIVHGDLNSNNVLLDADYTARLADFGYASLVGNIPEALAYLQRTTARPGALRWSAPEQILSEETFKRTTKSDIYAFGCVAVQVLSGKRPWSEVQEDGAVVLRLAKGQKPGRPESQKIDDSHWDLIQDCWSQIEERPAALTIISTLRQFLSHCLPSPPLCDSLVARSSNADAPASANTLSPLSPATTKDSRNESRLHYAPTERPPVPSQPSAILSSVSEGKSSFNFRRGVYSLAVTVMPSEAPGSAELPEQSQRCT